MIKLIWNFENVGQMKRLLTVLCLLVLSSFAASGQENAETPTATKDRKEAELLWEQMVKVRGGRERIYSITNLMVTQGNGPDDIQTQFYVYPNKFWEWTRDKRFHNITFIKMENLDAGMFGGANEYGLLRYEKVNALDISINRDGHLMESCRFVLETKWLQPKPVRVTQATLGKERFDVVETQFPTLKDFSGGRQDYYVDPESLVVRAVAYYLKGRLIRYYFFDGYTTVDGIQVPLKYNIGHSLSDMKKASYIPLNFRFNVNYDEKLFERPPSVEAGPDAWKRKP